MSGEIRKKRSIKEYLRIYITGLIMGGADVVPGVSGGTMAFILGIYEELIESIKKFTSPETIAMGLKFQVKKAFQTLPWPFLLALGLATYEELAEIYRLTARINEVLKGLFDRINVRLVDFKIEFGKTPEGEIVLADEVSPDSCRLWDATTGERLDKDRFRRDMGRVREAYEEILMRLKKITE